MGVQCLTHIHTISRLKTPVGADIVQTPAKTPAIAKTQNQTTIKILCFIFILYFNI
ncbi:MAG: hypothetical protein WCG25_09860 [bacterium]